MGVYLAMLLCGLGIAVMIYRYDMYDREPVLLLLLAIVLGAISVPWIGDLEVVLHEKWGGWTPTVGSLAAAVCEETAKLLLVVVLAFTCCRFFNDPMDGLIYGAFIGLGFGIGESDLYLSYEKDPGITVLAVEAVRLFLHSAWGGLDGYAIGLARFPKRIPTWPLWLIGGVGTAMVTHYLWDRHLGLVEITDRMTARYLAVGLMMALTLVFGLLVMRGSALSRELLAPEKRGSVWGWPFRPPADDKTDANG